MTRTILEAKAELEAVGLDVKPNVDESLWIAATKKDVGGGLHLSKNASMLIPREHGWLAVFPASGTLSFEVPGDLQELVPIIRSVYTDLRRRGGSLKDAFERTVPAHHAYLMGRFPSVDRSTLLPTSRRFEVGNDEGLKIRIEWSGSPTTANDTELTRGRILLWVAGSLVWGSPAEASLPRSERCLIDFLDHLSRVWPYLKWEERYPFGLQPRDPSHLRIEASTRWEMLGEERACEEAEGLTEFERRHDLSQGLGEDHSCGFVRLNREGNQMWIHSAQSVVLRPAMELLDQLSSLGDAISSRLSSAEVPRAREAVESWNRRDLHPSMDLAMISTGLSAVTIHWIANAVPSEGLTLDASPGEFQLTEILAAARMMVGTLDPDTVKAAITAIAGTPKVGNEKLDRLTDEAEGLLARAPLRKPYLEGYTLAGWLRKVLAIEYTTSVEPAEILELLGVLVKDIAIQDELLDALACWGPRHGPVVLLNRSGKHSQTSQGRKATLAHELCHLLIDREGALPLAEVLNGSAPWRVEARARAFAAEFLLPRRRAEEMTQVSPDIMTAVEELRSEYGVSRELAIRQIDNARTSLSPERAAELERMVSSLSQY